MSDLELVLGSMSAARRTMLEKAGVPVIPEAPLADEETLKETYLKEAPQASAEDLAIVLARGKALSLPQSQKRLVIAADQTLSCGGKIYNKANTLNQLREKLSSLRGKSHFLHSALSVSQDGAVVIEICQTAELTMRSFSDSFLDKYIEKTGEACLSSVGGYHYEGLGLQLFDKVEGDFYTILGMPLLPLLSFLRSKNAIPS